MFEDLRSPSGDGDQPPPATSMSSDPTLPPATDAAAGPPSSSRPNSGPASPTSGPGSLTPVMPPQSVRTGAEGVLLFGPEWCREAVWPVHPVVTQEPTRPVVTPWSGPDAPDDDDIDSGIGSGEIGSGGDGLGEDGGLGGDGGSGAGAAGSRAGEDEAWLLLASVAAENASGFGLVEEIRDQSKAICWSEAQRLILVARLYEHGSMGALPPPVGPAARARKPLAGLSREDVTVSELRARLHLGECEARRLIRLALSLTTRLTGTLHALSHGWIDLRRAEIIDQHARPLGDYHYAKALARGDSLGGP